MKSEEEQQPSPTKTSACFHCAKEFKYESEKRRHEKSHDPQFECSVCCKKFSFLSSLRRHEKQHDRKGNVPCDKCGGSFRDEILLKRHIRYAHKGKYTCTKCSAIFNSEPALRTHMKTHRPESERRFRCSFFGCEKSFNFTHHLKHHELTHTDDKQHFCKLCGKGFIQSHHLKIHQKSHEPDTWVPCTVPDCKKIFSYEYAMKRHLKTHKNKMDSGISSDSSANYDVSLTDKADIKKGSVLCTTCGQLILKRIYKKHTLKCIQIKEENCKGLSKSSELNSKDILITIEPMPVDELDSTNYIYIEVDKKIDTISNCKAALGGCIVSGGNDTNDDCLCAQITTSVDEQHESLIPGNTNVAKPRNTINETIEKNMSKGCDCVPTQKICKSEPNDMPQIEYEANGIVRIKETFDVEIERSFRTVFNSKIISNSQDLKNGDNIEFKNVPFNTCRDVLGNCIVSGNGTIGEGCLCAKMISDEQQMTSQEMDEITPRPIIT